MSLFLARVTAREWGLLNSCPFAPESKVTRQQKSRLSTAFLLCCSAPYKTADGIFVRKMPSGRFA